MKTAVVIGGGLAGLFSAKLLVKKGFKVKIIDSSKKLGGLISSVKYKNYYFDHGSHIAQETGDKDIDKILFSNQKKNFFSYKFLPQNHYFNNKWYNKSSFLNLNLLEKKKNLKYFNEILKKNNFKRINFKNEKERCEYLYGKSLTNQVFEPLIKKKTGYKLSNLPTQIIQMFNFSRIIIGKDKTINKLKKNTYYDKVLAFNSYRKGLSGRKNLYPKKKGINNLIELFLSKSFLSKVKIILNENIDSIKIENKKIKNIKTNKRTLNGDLFIWTGSVENLNSLIFKKIGKNINQKFYWNFFHYLTNKLSQKKIFYTYIYDKFSPLHRVTFYDNFQKKKNKKKKFRITVEYILPQKKIDTESANKEIVDYLKKIKILKKDNKIELVKNYNIPISIKSKNNKISKDFLKIKNLFVCGQVSGERSKQNIVIDIFNKISKV